MKALLRKLSPASIRARVVLLVLAVWVPAVAGLALQTLDAYRREDQAARDRIEQLAVSLGAAVDAELGRRVTQGKALAASRSLQRRDLPAFEAHAREVAASTGLHVFLVERERQLFYTAVGPEGAVARRPGSLFVDQGVGVTFLPRGPVSGQPAIALLVPETTDPPRFNIGIPFSPAAVQDVLRRHPVPEGGVASVIDGAQRVMARSRDPDKWLGRRASHPNLLALAERGRGGLTETTTLDGVASLTYLSPATAQGWQALVAMPKATLAATARRLAVQAVAVSALLLAIGLVVGLAVARRISQPVRRLEEAAGELLDRRVPEPLRTGLAEVDRVGLVLHDAGLRSREAEQLLESRVQAAVTEAREAEARLFEARKHEAIGRLTGGVAHDFNNLLQTISTGLQVVQRSVEEGRHTRPLQAALAACGKAADLVRQMLAFGRAQPLRPRPVDVADLLLRSRELTGKALGERIRLVAELDPALPAVLADPMQLELALLNLVFNARDAMPDGGTVTVRARVEPGTASGLEAADFVRVDVQDDGQGMDADTLSRVFEPYFTTKPVGRGSGLGLPQVQAFARQSGGDVRIASTPGQGTTVTMVLPVTTLEAELVPDDHGRRRRSQRRLRVLMVEDDVLVASVVPTALEHEGHAVTLCHTADEAKVLLESGLVADVLFTDIVMPGRLTGLELVAWCREHRPDLPALVATGYSDRAPEGVWKLLRKPYVIEDLLDALDAAAATTATA